MASKSHSSSSFMDLQANEIESIFVLSEHMAQQYLNEEFADITFITADGVRLPAHRAIIAARSEYFKAMLYGGLAETTQSEIRVQAPTGAFKQVLKFLYSGRISLKSIDVKTLVETLRLANQYGVEDLEVKIASHLERSLSGESIDIVFDFVQLYDLRTLSEQFLKLLDCHAVEILRHEQFLELSSNSLYFLLKRDTFFAPEIEIFRFVRKWLERHPAEQLNSADIISLVRLPLLTQDQLLDEVASSGLIEHQKIVEALSTMRFPHSFLKRHAGYGITKMELNVAMPALGTRVIKGIDPDNLLTKGLATWTTHKSGDIDGIIIELGNVYQINHIRVRLRDMYTYSYYVEISQDLASWERVIDYRTYKCRSWQNLYFETQPVHYIRLVGVQSHLSVISFEAKCVQSLPRILNQIIEPKENVATVEMGAKVIKGKADKSCDILLDGNLESTNGNYVHHMIDSNRQLAIIVQLNQPYIIGSMRLLLPTWNEYEFTIETSIDGDDWKMAVDKRGSWEHEWVDETFEPRPTVFIRISGTGDIKDKGRFHCIHFECPSQSSPSTRSKRQIEQQVGQSQLKRYKMLDTI